jgi:adenylate cyclase
MGKQRKRANLRRLVIEGSGLGLGAGLLVCLLALAGAFESLERLAVDALQRAWAEPASASDQIVLVALDQGSIEAIETSLDMSYPWPRSLYGEFVRFIDRGQPKAILFDMLFAGSDIDRDEILGADSDRDLASAIDQSGRVILGVSLRPPDPTPPAAGADQLTERMSLPLEAHRRLAHFARVDPLAPPLCASRARFGFVNALIDDDGLVRRAQLLAGLGDRVVPSLTLAGVAWPAGRGSVETLRLSPEGLWLGDRLSRLDDSGAAWIRYYGPGGPGPQGQGQTYRYIPIANLLRSAAQLEQGQTPMVDPQIFADKWVIIGSTSTALFDQKATPFSSEGNYPGMEIHASVLDNLLHGSFLWRVPAWMVWILILIAAGLIGLAGRLTRATRWNVTACLGTSAACFALSVGAFWSAGLIVDLVAVQAGVLASFVAVTIANFVSERRSRQQVRNIFQHYLDPRVVRGLLEAPDRLKLGGERRVCTVFFSDIAGFTGVAEHMQPEQLVELMNLFLGEMTEIIIQRGGFVDKYIGDAIMAVFGAPADLPGHAKAACQAALDCHRQMNELRRRFAEHGWPPLEIRVGLNTGEMIVGNMGSKRRMNYTVMGDAVNLASRLEGANKQFGSSSLVGPLTREQAGEDFLFRELDLLRVKGKQEPVRIHELLGSADQVTAAEREKAALFAQALVAYRRQLWAEALEFWRQLERRWPADAPTATYIQRTLAFQQSPPPADWDGVFVMTQK